LRTLISASKGRKKKQKPPARPFADPIAVPVGGTHNITTHGNLTLDNRPHPRPPPDRGAQANSWWNQIQNYHPQVAHAISNFDWHHGTDPITNALMTFRDLTTGYDPYHTVGQGALAGFARYMGAPYQQSSGRKTHRDL
jgi:hypothetical protein